MKNLVFTLLLVSSAAAFGAESAEFADKVVNGHGLSGTQAENLKNVLTGMPSSTRNIGTEDPDTVAGPNNSWHPVSRAKCIADVLDTGKIAANPQYEQICGAKWMSPVPGADGSIESAKTCIDQFEFPNLPCEYPVVWAPSSTAQKVCGAMGKRVCNSHEWEGACSGSLDESDPYLFILDSLDARKKEYNNQREVQWAFAWDPELAAVTDTREICGVYSVDDPDFAEYLLNGKASDYFIPIGKSKSCHSGSSDYKSCGTNTWPAGFKHRCKSRFDVYDMHGNVAEVTNFPTSPNGFATPDETDKTERKGSFFVYRGGYPDDCRVRQPYEHFHKFSTDQHSYYQEGFRCCKDVGQ